jgi:hypothetical protein
LIGLPTGPPGIEFSLRRRCATASRPAGKHRPDRNVWRNREQAGWQASSGSQFLVMAAGRSAAGRVTGNLPGKRELP